MKVIKRNGRKVNFDRKKIISAIQRANEDLQTENKITEEEIRDIAADIEEQYNEEGVVKSVEDIQDSIEKALMNNGYDSIAKSYILYRKQRAKLREINKTTLDYKKTVDDYLKVDDWRVKENSTVTYSIGGLILSNSGAITANYWLSEVYDDEIGNAHRNADIHIHDLSILSGYCAGWSLKQLIQEGLGGIPGKITSSPATHLSTLCNQMVNFLGIMQNEWAG